jgi:hypothetical protein
MKERNDMNHPEYYAGKLQEVMTLRDLKKYLTETNGKVCSYNAKVVNPTLHIIRTVVTFSFPECMLFAMLYVQDAFSVSTTHIEGSETSLQKYAHQYTNCEYRKLVGEIYYLSKEA